MVFPPFLISARMIKNWFALANIMTYISIIVLNEIIYKKTLLFAKGNGNWFFLSSHFVLILFHLPKFYAKKRRKCQRLRKWKLEHFHWIYFFLLSNMKRVLEKKCFFEQFVLYCQYVFILKTSEVIISFFYFRKSLG